MSPRLSKVIGFMILCLLVGYGLQVFDISPVAVWNGLWEHVRAAFAWLGEHLDNLLLTFLLGAAIVGPIYLVSWLMRRARRR